MNSPALEQESRVFFQVLVQYTDCPATIDIPEDSKHLESEAIDTFPRASEIAQNTTKAIQSKFPDTQIVELNLDQATDGYHLYVRDEDGQDVARVGIVYQDYSKETLH